MTTDLLSDPLLIHAERHRRLMSEAAAHRVATMSRAARRRRQLRLRALWAAPSRTEGGAAA